MSCILQKDQENPIGKLRFKNVNKFCDAGERNSNDVMEELLRYYSDDSGTRASIEIAMQ